ncbi:hypothetical protein CVT25_010090 [Psilocybe cyanescens]|uniref:Uncharacterized protein n=1 Tax=Psilocybe cyanescens TaxID=93625 RepID=A0A409XGR9_PSICY|nr:hypothetical protein CVT25_010090 [Psilocybe cyanescens]
MQDASPYLAQHTPIDAIAALKKKYQDYLDAVLAKALAVKVFSAMPVSMVDEWAMSVVTWLNSPKRRQQKVKTVADHLIICGFDQLHKKKPFQKLVTVNWQDIHATIQQNPQTVSTMSKNNYDEENEVSDNEELNSPVDPTHDHYKWLDDGLQGGTRI